MNKILHTNGNKLSSFSDSSVTAYSATNQLTQHNTRTNNHLISHDVDDENGEEIQNQTNYAYSTASESHSQLNDPLDQTMASSPSPSTEQIHSQPEPSLERPNRTRKQVAPFNIASVNAKSYN